jgi:hypothetical protein
MTTWTAEPLLVRKEHTLPALAVISAGVLAFVVADTLKLEPYGSVDGAPVKLTVGGAVVASAGQETDAEL